MRELLITSGGCWCMIFVLIILLALLRLMFLPPQTPFLCLWQCCRAGVQHWRALKSCLLQMQCDSFPCDGWASRGVPPPLWLHGAVCELGPSLFSLRTEAKTSSLVIAMPELLNLPEKLCLFLHQCLLTKPSIICLTYKLVHSFTTLPTFHLTELQEHSWWLWQSFIHVQVTNYLLIIQFLVESAVFQGGPGEQY